MTNQTRGIAGVSAPMRAEGTTAAAQHIHPRDEPTCAEWQGSVIDDITCIVVQFNAPK